jgi:hypothetical protein
MSFLVCLIGIKMAFLYWFIGLFWFLAAYSCPIFILLHKVRKLRRTFLPTPSRIYLIIGTILAIGCIILDDLFPYMIIYTCYGLTIDLLANPATSKSKYYSQFINTHVFALYIALSFFNFSNKKYYTISVTNTIIYFVLVGVSLIFNYVILCRGPGRGFTFLRKAFSGIVRYTEETRTDYIEVLSLRGHTLNEGETWVDYKNHKNEIVRRSEISTRIDLSDMKSTVHKVSSAYFKGSESEKTLVRDWRSMKVTMPNRFAENSLMQSILIQNKKV